MSAGNNTNVFNEDVTMQNRLFVGGNTTISGNQVVSGKSYIMNDAILKKRVFVSDNLYAYKDAIISGDIRAKNMTITGFFNAEYQNDSIPNSAIIGREGFSQAVTMDNSLSVEKDIIGNSRLYITGNGISVIDNDLRIKGNLIVEQEIQQSYLDNSIQQSAIINYNSFNDNIIANQGLVVTNDTSLNDTVINETLTVNGNTTVNNLNIGGAFNYNYPNNSIPTNAVNGNALTFNTLLNDLTMYKRVFVDDLLTAKQDLLVNGDTNVKNINATGNISVEKTLNAKDINASGNIIGNFPANSIPSSSIDGGALPADTLSKDVNILKRVFVFGNLEANDKLDVYEDATMHQKLKVSGNTDISGSLTVDGEFTAVYSANTIPGSAIINGVLPTNTLNNDVTMTKRLFVINDITTNKNIIALNDVSFNKKVNIGGNIVANNTLTVQQDATFNSDVTITGTLNANFAEDSIPASKISGGSLPGDALSNNVILPKKLTVTQDFHALDEAIFDKKITVTGNVTANRYLTVAEDATFAKDVTVTGTLNANFAEDSIPSSKIIGGSLPGDALSNDVTLPKKLTVTQDFRALDDAIFDKKITVSGNVIANNNLTVAENANFAKDVTITGNLNTNFANASIPSSAINGGALPANTHSNDVTMSQKLHVISDVSLNNKLYVHNDATMNDKLTVSGNVTANNYLTVAEHATFHKDVTVNGTLNATFADNSIPTSKIAGGALPADLLSNDVVFSKNITVIDSVTIEKDLIVKDDATITDNLTVNGNIMVNDSLFVTENSNFDKDVTISGNLTANYTDNSIPSSAINGGVLSADTFSNDVIFGKNLTVTQNLIVDKDVTIKDDATITDNLTVNGNIYGKANAYFDNDVTILGNLTAGFAPNSIPANAVIGGGSSDGGTTNGLPADTLLNDVTMTKRLFVNDKITALKDAHVNDDLSVGNKLTVDGTSTLNNTLSVAENATFDKNVTIMGALNATFPENSIPSSKIIDGTLPANALSTDVTIGNNLTVTNNATINKDLTVTDDATIGDKFIVNGTTTLNNTLSVAENATFDKDVTITGALNTTFPENSIPSSKIIGGVLPADSLATDVTIGNNLTVTNNATINKDLIVKDDAKFEEQITVTGVSTMNGDLIVNGKSKFIGDISINNVDFMKDSKFLENVEIAKDLVVKGKLEVENYTNNSIINTTTTNYATIETEDIDVTGGITVSETATVQNLSVTNNATINEELTVKKDVILEQNLTVANDFTVNGTFTATPSDNSILPSKIIGGLLPADTFSNDIYLDKKLFVESDVSMNNDLYVKQNLTVDGTLNVTHADNSIPLNAIQDVQSLAPDYNTDINMTKNVTVGGILNANSVTINGDVEMGTVGGEVKFRNDIEVFDDISMGGTLRVGGDAGFRSRFYGDLDVCGNFYANYGYKSIPASAIDGQVEATPNFSGDVGMSGNLVVTGIITSNLGLNVTSGITSVNTLTASGTISGVNGLNIQGGSVSFPNNSIPLTSIKDINTITPDYSQNITMDSNLTVDNKLTVKNGLDVEGTVSFPNASIPASAISGLGDITPNFTGPISMNDDLTVKKRLFVELDVSMNNDLYVQKNLTVDGIFNASYSNGSIPLSAVADTNTITPDYTQAIVMTNDLTANRLFVTQDVSLNQNLYVGGNVTLNSNVTITKDLTVMDDMTVTDNFTAKNGLIVEAGIVSFPNASISANAITGLGEVTPNFAGAVTMNDDLTVKKRLFVTQKSTLGNDTDINGDLDVTGNVDVTGSVDVDGLLKAKDGFTVVSGTVSFPAESISASSITGLGDVTPNFTGAVTMNDDLTVKKRLFVTQKSTLGNDTDINGDLDVTGNVDVTGLLKAKDGFTVVSGTISVPDNSIPLSAVSGTDAIQPDYTQHIVMDQDLTTHRLFVVDNTNLNGNLTVNNNNTIINKVQIVNDTISSLSYQNLNLTTTNAVAYVSINRKLSVYNNNLEVTDGNIITNQDMEMRDITVTGNTTFPNGSISADAISGLGDVTPNFAGAVSMSDTLTVANRITASNGLTVSAGTITVPAGSIPLSAVADTDTLQPDYSQPINMNAHFNAHFGMNSGALNIGITGATDREVVKVSNGDFQVNNGSIEVNNGSIEVNNGSIDVDWDVTSSRLFVQDELFVNSTATINLPNASIPASAISGLGDVTPNFAGPVSMSDTLTVTNLLTASNGLAVTGDFTVSGTTTTLNTTNLDISDSILQLSSGLTSATPPVNDSGLLINRGNEQNAFMGWDETNDQFVVGLTDDSTGSLNITKQKLATGDININGDITVTGATTFANGSISADAISGLGDVTPNFSGAVIMNDNLTVSGNLFVPTHNSYATIGNIKIMDGDIYAIGEHLNFNTDGAGFRIMMQKDVDIINSKLTVMNDDIEVANGNITTNQDITMRDITVAGNVSFPNGSIPLSAVSGTEAIQPDYTQAIVMTDDLTVNKRLFVNDNITMTGKFIKQW